MLVRKKPSISQASSTIGKHLLEWRRIRGMSQQDAAFRAGIHRTTLSKVERGDTSVSIDTLLSLAAVYGITDKLLSGSNPMIGDEGTVNLLSAVRARTQA